MTKEEYLHSFVNGDKFASKQFQKYISKVEKSLNQTCLDVFPELSNSVLIQADDGKNIAASPLESFVINTFLKMYIDPDSKKNENPPLNLINTYAFNDIVEADDEAKLEICNVLIDNKDRKIIIDTELINSCKDWIKMFDVNINNYFTTIPKNEVDNLKLLNILLNRINIDIERISKRMVGEAIYSILQDESTKYFTDRISKSERERDEFREKYKKAEAKVTELEKKSLDTDMIKQELVEIYSESNEELLRKISKLQDKYNKLAEKYNNYTVKEDSEKVEIIEPEVDTNKKYGFVIRDNDFSRKILKYFPNSVIIKEGDTLDNIELVIFITSFIGHSLYYEIKNKCKNAKIPYIHCNTINIELIKKTISLNY